MKKQDGAIGFMGGSLTAKLNRAIIQAGACQVVSGARYIRCVEEGMKAHTALGIINTETNRKFVIEYASYKPVRMQVYCIEVSKLISVSKNLIDSYIDDSSMTIRECSLTELTKILYSKDESTTDLCVSEKVQKTKSKTESKTKPTTKPVPVVLR